MSLQLFGVVGALVMGLLVTPSAANAYSITVSAAEELAQRMHQDGIKKSVNPQVRKDLKSIVVQARRYADELDLGCDPTRLYEVRFAERSQEWIVGYGATIECEDAPAPLSMYFDVNLRLLSVFEYGG